MQEAPTSSYAREAAFNEALWSDNDPSSELGQSLALETLGHPYCNGNCLGWSSHSSFFHCLLMPWLSFVHASAARMCALHTKYIFTQFSLSRGYTSQLSQAFHSQASLEWVQHHQRILWVLIGSSQARWEFSLSSDHVSRLNPSVSWSYPIWNKMGTNPLQGSWDSPRCWFSYRWKCARMAERTRRVS